MNLTAKIRPGHTVLHSTWCLI